MNADAAPALIAGVSPAVLASVICRRLPAIAVETVIDSIGPAGYRIHDTIGGDGGAGIKVRRPVIMEIEFVRAGVPVAVGDILVRGKRRRCCRQQNYSGQKL
jgi:hypothetical protein